MDHDGFRPLWGFLFIQSIEKYLIYKLRLVFRPLWGFLFIQSYKFRAVDFDEKISVPSGDFSLFNYIKKQYSKSCSLPSPLGISLYSIIQEKEVRTIEKSSVPSGDFSLFNRCIKMFSPLNKLPSPLGISLYSIAYESCDEIRDALPSPLGISLYSMNQNKNT